MANILRILDAAVATMADRKGPFRWRFAIALCMGLSLVGLARADELAAPTTADRPGGIGLILGRIRDGGPIMIPLGICSFLVFVFIFERTISLRSGRVIPKPFVRRFLEQLDEGAFSPSEAAELCQANGSPVSEIFLAGVMKWDRPAVEVEQAIIDAGERVSDQLRRNLRALHGISTISPLLGLLGTVLGMIGSFQALALSDAMGRPEILARGISEALITTAAGLTVAIPSIVAYLMFSSRVERLAREMDQHAQQLVNAVACDGWQVAGHKKPSKPVPKAA